MERTTSYCRICAAGCGIIVTSDEQQIVGVEGDLDHPTSRGYLCAKGRGLADWHHRPDRLDVPRLRGQRATWDETLDDLATALGQLRSTGTPDAIALYLATGLAYDAAGQMIAPTWLKSIGSRSFLSAATVDNAPALVAAEMVTGNAMVNPAWDPLGGGLLLIIGSTPVVSHGYGTALPDPIRHLRQHRANGGRLWVVDPRATETAHQADEHIQIVPGTDVALLATLAAALLALAHWEQLEPGESVQLHSRSGPLEGGLMSQRPGWGHLCLPSAGLIVQPCPAELDALLAGQGLGPCQAFWSSPLGYRVGLLAAEAPLALMACPAEALRGDLRQGLVLMQSLPTADPREEGDGEGITIPDVGGEKADYQLRFFAPDLGIEEDPVTGSAHALVAPWWMERLQRSQVRGWQPSPRRGGMLCDDAGPGLVRLTGAGQLLWDGQINASGSGCDPDDWQHSVRL